MSEGNDQVNHQQKATTKTQHHHVHSVMKILFLGVWGEVIGLCHPLGCMHHDHDHDHGDD